jgi:hypothetical protein
MLGLSKAVKCMYCDSHLLAVTVCLVNSGVCSLTFCQGCEILTCLCSVMSVVVKQNSAGFLLIL